MMHTRAAVVIGVLCATVELTSRTQSLPVSPTEFIAFRFDDTHVIAVVKVLDIAKSRADRQISSPPAARYGFPYFDAPPELGAHVPAALQEARWLIHAAPGQAFEATADKVVGGTAQCSTAVGLHLTVAPAQAPQFARTSPRYFVAEAQATAQASGDGAQVAVRSLPTPMLPDTLRSKLESVLNNLMTGELPAIRSEMAPAIERMAKSDGYHRSWVVKLQRIDRLLSEGAVKLTYDIQAFQLDPSGTPTYFVRAEWLAGRDQAFAASVWLRSDSFEIVQANTRPASWLRMFEFQGKIDREQLGLVLNVLDRDRDGWGEIVFARGGYESLGIDVREWSSTGFVPSGVEYSFGC